MILTTLRTLSLALGMTMAIATAAAAQPLICFGNEPFWRVSFPEPGRAEFATPDDPPIEYNGKETRNEPLKERLWRGRAATGGELVVFLREGACSDGMSDDTHPFSARVSTPDGEFFTGCCRVPAPQTKSAIEGASWRLVSLPGQAADTLSKLERGVVARFDEGRLTGFAGCNTFTGSYTLEAQRLTVGVLAGTMMACPEPAMSVERAFHGAMTGTLSYSVEGDRLSLTTGSGAQLLFVKQAAQTPDGGTWEVTGYNNGRQAVVSPMTGTQLTVAFANGMVTGSAGCNTFRATYYLDGSRIAVGKAITTRKMCEEAVMTQEREFLSAIQSATVWSIDSGGLLHLHRPDEERVLVAGPRRP